MHSKCGVSLTTWVLLMFVMWMCTSAMAGFAEMPANVTVELGTETPFRCRHMISDALISWSVNGSSAGRFPDIRSGFVNESGTIVDTLTVPAELQYNGTVVECVAVLFDESPPVSEVSPAATILLTPTVSLPETTHFEMTPTNTPPGTTNFVITPSPLTVAVEQGTATFQCQHPLAAAIGWRVNGILLNTATLQNVSTVSVVTQNGVTTILSIGSLLENNGTTVECIATFIDGSSPILTTPVPLFIQDTPKQVENATCLRDYSEDELTTLWNPLPTLDINDTDPDILYTVELYQITCGQNILINRTEVAGSNVTGEGLDLMQIYKAVIAARNNVRGARNGPTAEMKEKFMSLNGPTLVDLTRNNQINIHSDTPVPSYYEMILESLDGREDLVTNITVERNGEMIDMHVEESVPPNSLWRAAILAYGCESDRIVTNYELSTHDIQNVVAISQLPGQISVTGELISGAIATGVFVVVYSLTSSEDMHYIAKQTEGNVISLDVTGLTGAEYGVSTFALENGLPLPSVVASPKNIAVRNGHQDSAQQQPPLIEYELTATNSSHVCITCTFLESSATDCMVVVHQQISQLSSSGLMNITGHKFTRSGDTAYGCIEGVNLEQHHVGVNGGKMITTEPKPKNRESYLAGAITGILGGIAVPVIVTVAVIVAVIACTHLKRRRKTAAQPVYSQVTRHSGSQPHTIVSDSKVAEKHYAGLSERPAEEQLLLPPPPLPPRVEDDGRSTPPGVFIPPVSDSATLGTIASPHQITPDNGAGDPTYTPVLARTPNAVSQPAVTEKVSYEDIQKYQNEQGQHYSLPQLKVTSKKGPVDDLHQVVYTEVKPHSMTKIGDQNINCTSDWAVAPPIPSRETATVAVCEPITTDQLFSFLLPHASKWQSLGETLSLDEDQLDEIFTNNERDEDCLREMLELYMMRSDLDHSWEEVHAALEKMESSSDAPIATSVQEVSSSQNSPVVSGETMLVPGMDADSDPDKQATVGKELKEGNDHKEEEGNSDSDYCNGSSQLESSDSSVVLEMEDDSLSLSQTSSEELHEASEKNRSMLNPLSDNLKAYKQGESSDSGYSGSQQSESESSDSSVVLEMESDSTSLSQTSSEELPEASEKNRSMLNPLSENLKDKQGESSDSGYDYSQQSESESRENSFVLEMEDDSMSLSQAALDEQLEASEMNDPILLSGDLEDYESRVDPSFGSQTTLTDGGEFGRPTIEELPMPPSTPINSPPGLQLKRWFCERPEDKGNSDELCKIKPVHCQDSCIHDNYHEALIHQMGLLTDHKARDKLEYNNAVEESSLVHIDSEQASKSDLLDVDFCTPKTFPALDIPKVHVHELVPQCFSVSPKYLHLLMLTAIQVENDRFVTLRFAGVILSLAYLSKLDAIISVCPVKVCVRCVMNID